MKLKKNSTPYFLLYIFTIASVFGSMIGNSAIANPTFFQCQLKNGHMTFSDQPCQSNQKVIQNQKTKKSTETQTMSTISVTEMGASTANNPKDCAYLDRLGIKRKYDQRTRTVRLKYWRADQTDELKEALVNLNKMKDKELEGC